MLGMTARPEAEIMRGVTETLQRDLENARRTYEYKQTLEYSSETLKAKALEACVQKIASIQSRISAIEERITRAGSQTCPICYCDISGTAVVPCCQQIFCFGCIAQSLQRSPACPLCRTAIETIQAIRVVDTSGTQLPELVSTEKRPPSRLSKKDAFLQFVAEHRDARILMFSSYDATFGRMESELTALGCAYATLNGSQARITKLLKDFKDGKYNVLFLNARNMGAGLNIDSASHVVLYHRMNKELENQIVGRAVRLGRTADLSVVHLLHENELGDRLTHV
jgi:SNF2 family DNA or RNA helicase